MSGELLCKCMDRNCTNRHYQDVLDEQAAAAAGGSEIPESQDPVMGFLREHGWDGERSEVDPIYKEEAEIMASTDKPEHLNPWEVVQSFIDMIDRSLKKEAKEEKEDDRHFAKWLTEYEGITWQIDRMRLLLTQRRQPEVPSSLISYSEGRNDGYNQMRNELAHNLLKVYMYERIEDGQDPASVAIEEAVKLGYLTEDPDNPEQYVLTLLGIHQAKQLGDLKAVEDMVRGWWEEAAAGVPVEADGFVDGEGATWNKTSNGKYWCGDNPNDEQGDHTLEEVRARFGIRGECSLEDCSLTEPHYHRGDDEVVRTDPGKIDPLGSMIEQTQKDAEDEASQQAIVQQHVKEDQ